MILPVTDREGVFYFSKKQLKRFGLELPMEISSIAVFK
jgi:hypothetical protein